MLVPPGFDVPQSYDLGWARLEPLRPSHTASDYLAWTNSVDYIRSLPDFQHRDWPTRSVTPEQNTRDLEKHAEDFQSRSGFTYTVLNGDDLVIGCLYIYPDKSGLTNATVRSWLRASESHLDVAMRESITGWLRAEWPFGSWTYGGQVTR
jgi:hypothetical protein